MADTIKRTFYVVEHNKLGNIPLTEGNYIVTSDTNGMYYDIGNPQGSGQNVQRRSVSASYEILTSLPDSIENPGNYNVFYIVRDGVVIGTNIPRYRIYIWDGTAYVEVSNNTSDINVVTDVNNNVKFYISGSTAEVSTTGTLVKNSGVYVDAVGKIHAGGFMGGTAERATNADTAETATAATYDSKGNLIAQYIKSIAPSGSSSAVTITFGDPDISPLTINTYVPGTVSQSAAGLAPRITNPNYFLSGSGWVDLGSGITVDSAQKDGLGQNIADTYIKALSYTQNTRKLTYTKGDGDTGDVELPVYTGATSGTAGKAGLVKAPATTEVDKFLKGDGTWAVPTDTTYNDYSGIGSQHGLVPASSSGYVDRYLNVTGTWAAIPTMIGASAGANGVAGLVPAPTSAQTDKFLRGNGQWDSPTIPDFTGATGSDNGASGAVPAPLVAERGKFLCGNGNWENIPDVVGTDGLNPGVSGAVPAPEVSDYNKFLRGNGEWATPSVPLFNADLDGIVPATGGADPLSHLAANGTWQMPIVNTAGTGDIGVTVYHYSDTFYGDGTTTAFTLLNIPNAGTLSVTIDGTAVAAADYTVSGKVVTFNTAPTIDNVTDTFTIADPEGGNAYTLSKTADTITSVKINNVSLTVGTDYEITDNNNTLVILDQSSYSVGDTIEIIYTHNQVIVADYSATLSNAKLFIVGAPIQTDAVQTYTDNKVYITGDKLYSNDKEVATVDQIPAAQVNADWTASSGVAEILNKPNLAAVATSGDYGDLLNTPTIPTLPTVETDTSFTPATGFTVVSKKYGSVYSITIDGTADSALAIGDSIATTTTTFNKVYAVGVVGSNLAMFTLGNGAITCANAINQGESIQVSFSALA